MYEFTDGLYAVILTGVFVTLGFFIFFHSSLQKIFRKSETFSNCKNPECIRCKTYNKTLRIAHLKLKQLQKLRPDLDITTIEESLSHEKDGNVKSKLINSLSVFISPQKQNKLDQNPQVFKLYRLATDSWIINTLLEGDVEILQRNVGSIAEEFKIVMDKKEAIWLVNDTPDGCWSVCHLINQGCIVKNNAAICPHTMKIVSLLPSIMRNNVFGNVAFSVIKPGTVITQHYGPTNVRARCHLGLVTPLGCKLTVNGESRIWSYGKCLIFDDSYLHGVAYASSSYSEGSTCDIRAVLMLDLWNPGVTPVEREIIDFIFPPKTL